jgi:MinD superfamily P-loop ATPase
MTLIDAPPGTSCATIEAVRGSDYCLLVTEPTPFGLHDLTVSMAMLAELNIPAGVLINREGLAGADIEAVCRAWQVPVVGHLPFDEKIAWWTSAGEMIVERSPRYATYFGRLARRLLREAAKARAPIPPAEPWLLKPVGELPIPAAEDLRKPSPPQCVVVSGKGGTGKTMLTASLAALADRGLAVDCDADAPNLHLVLGAVRPRGREYWGTVVARVDPQVCTRCGECIARCRFGALAEGPDGAVAVDELRCAGCGMCALVCPVTDKEGGAMALVPRLVGTVLESETVHGPLVHAELAVGSEASGRLVTELRRQAQATAALRGVEEMLMDGPPGTGCPVNASVVDTDLAVVVTEPGVAARHDLERALELLRFLGVAAVVVINKCDVNDRERELLETVAQSYGAPVVARIPFDRSIVDALAQGTPPVLSEDCRSRDLLRGLAEVIRERLWNGTVVAGDRR